MILQKTINLFITKYKQEIETLSVSDVRIGVFMTAVKLSDNSYGIASTVVPKHSEVHCKKENRDFGEFTPGKMTDISVLELLETSKKNELITTLQIAVLNAISSRFLETNHYKILRNTDPIDLIDYKTPKTITMVGAFHSYIKKISKSQHQLFVLEFNEDMFSEEDKKYYVPANEYASVLPLSDIVLITGLTLVNNTLDDLLQWIKPHAQIIVTGPSSSFIPDILFEKGINCIGAVKITNPELMLKIISQAGAGYHTFEYCAEKICVLNER